MTKNLLRLDYLVKIVTKTSILNVSYLTTIYFKQWMIVISQSEINGSNFCYILMQKHPYKTHNWKCFIISVSITIISLHKAQLYVTSYPWTGNFITPTKCKLCKKKTQKHWNTILGIPAEFIRGMKTVGIITRFKNIFCYFFRYVNVRQSPLSLKSTPPKIEKGIEHVVPYY